MLIANNNCDTLMVLNWKKWFNGSIYSNKPVITKVIPIINFISLFLYLRVVKIE